MKKYLIRQLINFHTRERSRTYRIVSLIGGGLFFLIILPALFIFIGFFIKDNLPVALDRPAELVISIAGLLVGMSFLIWTTVSQWKIGEGTPAPNAPTRRLVVAGPYRLCRNPIEFGAIFYYLGAGTLVGGITVGIVCFLLGFLIGSAYHKFFEEDELEIRFGDEYRHYKKKTPFLFPRFK